ncbi:MAG: site-2 protease family protein [Bacteroidetes bacterium]|nr:site-2 protease family protein [Bacteroidota bacterium]
MESFKEFLRFPEIEKAAAFTELLERHHIPYRLDDHSMRFEVVSAENPWLRQFILMLKEEDFQKTNELLEKEPLLSEDGQSHFVSKEEPFLKDFSDDELKEVMANPAEWSKEALEEAKEMALKRSLEIPAEHPFPPKPVETTDEYPWLTTFRSLLLFVLIYYVALDHSMANVLILVIVIFIHELGHYIAMKAFHYSEVKMFFIPLLGAMVSGVKNTISQRHRAIILLAGPVPGMIIGFVLYKTGATENPYMRSAANLFIIINAFNLLPITPFDGGKLIETLFFLTRQLLQNIFTILSAAGLVIFAIYFKDYFFLLFPFFMVIGISAQAKRKKIQVALKEEGIDCNKPFGELTNEEYAKIRSHVIAGNNKYQDIKSGDYSTSVEDSIISKIKSLAEVQITKDLPVSGKIIFVLLWLVFLVSPLLLAFF